MKTIHTLLFLAPTLGLATQPQAQQAQQTSPGLVRIQPFASQQTPFDAEAWRTKLAAVDLDQREQDFAAMAQRLRRDPEARAEVEKWAREGDSELAWTARLLLRESEGRGQVGLGGAFAGPRGQLFQIPDLGLGGGSGLDAWLQDFDPNVPDDFFLAPNAPRVPPSSQGGANSKSQSFEMRSGPDGVHVTILEDENGNTDKKEYTAESMDKLLEEHPELADRLGGQALWLTPGMRATTKGDHALQFFFGDPDHARALGTPAPRTDVLGVTVRALPKGEAKMHGLAEGVGLVVERVEPRSVAEALGIQRGHVLVEMNEHELHAAQDITDQLCARAADGEIRVKLIDRWGQNRTRTWTPEPKDAGQAAPSKDEAKKPELRKI
ncbi:MAG: PDZ domain-containing protein [Planctomycetes bacterium]|nr:PDZ domain-containing protein [Planctomycetota bacterium]